MKRGTPEHPKMLALSRALSIPRFSAVGLMETLWHWASRFAPQGDIGKWSDTAIADGATWEGDAEQFVSALTEIGWLDASAEYRLVIHDWEEHADGTVKKYLQRQGLTFLSGNVQTCPDNGGKRLPRARALPSPVPSPVPSPSASASPAADTTDAPDTTDRPPIVSIPAPNAPRIGWIRSALSGYMAQEWGAPDDGICRQIDSLLTQHGRGDPEQQLKAVLQAKLNQGKRPGRSWAWFVSVIRGELQAQSQAAAHEAAPVVFESETDQLAVRLAERMAEKRRHGSNGKIRSEADQAHVGVG